ncbi:MAG: phosphatase PAP2 family protein [Dehalococcoidia bacterium]|nr:phosphatase PAP2 family protein [Dehalococcoidia bacterium]
MRAPVVQDCIAVHRTERLAPWLERASMSPAWLVLQVGLLGLMTLSTVTKTWHDHLWLGFVLVGVTGAAWSVEFVKRRDRLWWFAYVAGIFFYDLLRAFADETAIPIRSGYVSSVDRALFFGMHPVESLQKAFFSTTSIGFADYFAVGVHWSFFIAPHAMAILIFVYRRPLFKPYVATVVGTMYLGLLLFFLLPTAPPWLAASEGQLHGVYRVMDFVGGKVNASTYQSFYAALGEPNSVAAMPSIHMGVTFAMYLWSRVYAPAWRWPLLVYTLVMGLALVYLAEHYVLDLVVGMVCACIAWWFSRPLAPGSPALSHSPAPE